MIELPVTLTSTGGAVSFASPVTLGYTKNKGVYRLLVTAEGEWQGLTIRCFWHLPGGTDPASSLVQDGFVDVPASVTAQPGTGCITFEGSDGEKTVTSADLRYKVGSNSGTEDGTMPEPGTPAWEQLVSATKANADAAERAKQDAETAAKEAENAATKADAAATKAEAAQKATERAEASAAESIAGAKADALSAIGTSKQSALDEVQQAQETATGAVQSAQAAAESAVDAAKNSAVQAVEAAAQPALDAAAESAANAEKAAASEKAAADSLQELKDGIASGNFKGDKGDTGRDGTDGKDGAPGVPGPKGDPGVVSASAPLVYNSISKELSISVGSGLTVKDGVLTLDDEVTVTTQNANLLDKSDTTNQVLKKIFYAERSSFSFVGVNGDTAIYFPVGKWGAGNYKFPIDYAQYGGSAAYRIAIFKEDKAYIKTKTSVAVDTFDPAAHILSLDITQTEIDSGAYYIGLSIRTAQLGTSAMVVKDIDYPAAYIEYGTTTSTYKMQKLENGLTGKKASFCGDSICAGTSVGAASSIYGQGWAGIIGVKNGMDWQNLGVNGATVAETSASSGTLIVINQLAQAYSDADYIILEGGCNDFDQMSGKTDATTMGEITAVWDDSYIKTTFAGALEHLFYTAVTSHPKAKIGYIIPPIMGRRNWTQYETISYRVYYNLAIDICKKWGIPYIDLWYESPLNPNLTVYYDPLLGTNGNISDGAKCYVDGQHLTEAGYNLISPKIEAWMRTL